MAFPQKVAENSGLVSSNSTSHPVNLPAGIGAGDLLLVMMAFDTNPSISSGLPAGWASERFHSTGSTSATGYALWKIADGSETNFTLTMSTSETSAHRSYRVTGAHGTSPVEISTQVTAATSSPNPPAFDPAGWGVEDTLWIAMQYNDQNISVTGYPTNYVNTTNDSVATAGGCGLGLATRELAAGSEDPGAFTLSGAIQHGALVIAVRPAGAALVPGQLSSMGGWF